MTTKPGLEQEYEDYVRINSEDEYSKACVVAGEQVADLLDQNKTVEEALEGLKGLGLTGFMAAMAAKAIAHFHPRGEEVRKVWNKELGASDEQEGLLNPAVVTVDRDGTITPDVEGV